MMSTKKALEVKKIIERVKVCLNLKTDIELANMLEIKQNTISAWRKRGNIDLPKIITLCEPTGVSMDWLIYGKENQCSTCSTTEHDATSKIMDMLQSMTEEQKRDVLKYVEKEKLFEELMKKHKSA